LGRQLNFYAGPRDTQMLAHELRKKGAVIIGDRSPKSEPVVADLELPLFKGSVSACLVRKQDLHGIRWWHYPKLGYFVLDPMESPIVQFQGSIMQEQIMLKGRLWFSPATVGGLKKPADFVRWADTQLRVVRKVFPCAQRPKGYPYSFCIGPEAAAMRAAGQVVFEDEPFMAREDPAKC
jgi:hypothetical protein